MPVTARLSQRFYEKLGEEATTELVNLLNSVDERSRNDLQDINQRNWEAFRSELRTLDARWDARTAESAVRWEKRFDETNARLVRLFAETNARVDKLFAEADARWEKRFTESEARWEKRFTESEARWEKRFTESQARTDKRFNEMELSIANLRTYVAETKAELMRWMFIYWSGTLVALGGLMVALRQGLFG